MTLKKFESKYDIITTAIFEKNYKKIVKQGKDLSKLKDIVNKLANKIPLDKKYKNHKLINDKYYRNCYECHIEPDWLLIYQYVDDKLILILSNIGSHSELFK